MITNEVTGLWEQVRSENCERSNPQND